MSAPEHGRLPCGRDADEILDQVAAGRAAEHDGHQRDCPHCLAALREYDRLWSPVREASDEPVAAPDSIIEAALARIRNAMSEPDHALVESARGVTRISARVVVAAARLGAEQVDGVRVALSRRLADDQGTDPGPDAPDAAAERVVAGVAGGSVAVQIVLAADYGRDLVALGEEVRRSVTRTVRRLTDLDPAWVTVVIDDVLS